MKIELSPRAAALCLVMALATSCVDDTYNFTQKEVSTTLQLLNQGVTIPIGTTAPITLSDMIEDNEIFTTVDGVLTISQGDSFTHTIDAMAGEEGITIKEVTASNSFSTTLSNNTQESARLSSSVDITAEIATGSSELLITTEVPALVKRLYGGNMSQNSAMTMNVTMSGVSEDIDEVGFETFTVQLPKFINFAAATDDNDNALIGSGNVLLITSSNAGAFTKSGTTRSFEAIFEIEGLDFTSDDYTDIITPSATEGENPTMEIEERVTYGGELYINGLPVASVDSKIDGNVEFTICDMNVTEVFANIEMEVELPNTPIEIGNLTDELGEGATVELTLSRPEIILTVTNPLEVAFEVADFQIDRYINDIKIDPITVETFVIPAKNREDEQTEYTIVISPSGDSSEEEIGVAAPMLAELFAEGIPSSLEVIMSAGVYALSDGTYYTIDLTQAYDLGFDFEVVIPLSFEDMLIETPISFSGLSESLAEVAEIVSAINIAIEAQNSIPLEISLYDAKAYDAEGNDLQIDNILGAEGRATLAAGVVNEDGSTSPTQSSIAINLSETEETSALKRLETIDLTIAVTTAAGTTAEVMNSQSIEMFIAISLPEGIIIPEELQ